MSLTPDELAAGQVYNYRISNSSSEGLPGASVFYRDEAGLPFTMTWVRHHHRYDD